MLVTSKGVHAIEVENTSSERLLSNRTAPSPRKALQLIPGEGSEENLHPYEVLMNPISIDFGSIKQGSHLNSRLAKEKLKATFSLTEPIVVNETTLQFLGKIVENVVEEMKEVHNAGLGIHRR